MKSGSALSVTRTLDYLNASNLPLKSKYSRPSSNRTEFRTFCLSLGDIADKRPDDGRVEGRGTLDPKLFIETKLKVMRLRHMQLDRLYTEPIICSRNTRACKNIKEAAEEMPGAATCHLFYVNSNVKNCSRLGTD